MGFFALFLGILLKPTRVFVPFCSWIHQNLPTNLDKNINLILIQNRDLLFLLSFKHLNKIRFLKTKLKFNMLNFTFNLFNYII